MTISKILLAGIISLALVGCASRRIPEIKANPPKGGAFEIGLHKGYVKLAEMEAAEYDWADADEFAERAEAVSMGHKILPEEMSARELPKNRVPVLSGARERLVSALDAGGRKIIPGDASQAQVMFDCWMQEQEENFQPKDIDACRHGFIIAMENMELAMAPKPEPKPMPKPKPMALPTLPAPMIVYFAFDSAKLDAEAISTIDRAVALYNETKAMILKIAGHTDRAGASNYNQLLSQKRINSVIKALKSRGLSDQDIFAKSYGEKDPAVKTNDGVANAKNRRVNMEFSR
jgi:outer membrane protein OmpA-like peptidoglycan-associated protein